MSRSRSVSLEIVPPNNSNLAAVLDAVFKNNSKRNEDDGRGLEDAEADPEEELQAQSNTISGAVAVYPPTPCERCVRTKKTCKGVAGARCEYCKRLKQKCSNSTGPARGKHAIPKQPKVAVASASKLIPVSTGSDSAKWQDRPKRKALDKPSVSQNGNTDDGEGSDDEEDGRDVQQNANKKRRLFKSAPGSGPSRAPHPLQPLLVKAMVEMEASIKRVQSSVAKEVERMNGIVKSLNAKIKEMDED